MRIRHVVFVLGMLVLVNTGCHRKLVIVKTTKITPSGRIPPGQAKKVTGSQSAKAYAPGQQKKKG